MRLLLLILMSFCAFAVEPDIHLPTGKDLPAWAKDLSNKYEAAYGDNAPWRKLYKKVDRATKETEAYQPLKSKAESEYIEAYETALENFAKTGNLKNIPKGTETEIWDYKTGLAQLQFRTQKDWRHDKAHWQTNDDFYIAYAKVNHDPLPLAFLWLEKNRDKYCR